MKNCLKIIFGIFLLVFPLSGWPQAQQQEQQRAQQGPQPVGQPGGAVVGQQINLGGGQQEPGVGLPAGRQANCNSLGGSTGMLQRQTVRAGNADYVTCFGWNPLGYPTSVINSAGFVTEFQFDLLGRPIATRDASGEDVQQIYNAKSQMQQLTRTNNWNPTADPVNRTMQFQYNSVGDLSQEQLGGGQSSRLHYTPDAEMKSVIGADGVLANFFSFQDGVLNSTGVGLANDRGEVSVETLGRTGYQYDFLGRVSQISDGIGNQTTFQYLNADRDQHVISPDQSSVYSHYNDSGTLRWREVRDRSGAVLQRTEFTYDNMGRITEIWLTKPGNNSVWKVRRTYQDNGLTVVTSLLLNETQYSASTTRYDGLGRVLSQESPGAGTLNYSYSNRTGQLERVQHSATGLVQRMNYDALGRLEWIVDGLSNFVRYEYNGVGDLARIFRSGGTTIQMKYDTNGRLLSKDVGAIQRIGYSYDAAGRLQGFDFGAFAGPRNNYQRETGLLDNVAFNNQILFDILETNRNGQTTRSRDANNVTFRMDYDSMGRPTLLTAEKEGGFSYRSWSYYDDGKVRIVAESVGLQPGQFGEVTNAPGGSSQNVAVRLVNRALGRPTYDNHLKSVVYFAYDVAGNVIEENRWIQGRWLQSTAAFASSAGGLLSTLTYPSGYQMERTTDGSGRLASVLGRNGDNIRGQINYNFVANSARVSSIRYGTNEAEERYTHDAAGRITAITVHKVPAAGQERQLARVDYKFSPMSLLIAKKETISPAANQNLIKGYSSNFDDLGRVIAWSSVTAAQVDGVANNAANNAAPLNADALQRYFYNQKSVRTKGSTRDLTGALFGSALMGLAYEYTFRADGSLQSASKSACDLTQEGARARCQANVAAVDIAFDPDGNGNIRAARAGNAAGPTYSYDFFGRLHVVNDPANRNRRIQYDYDGLGRLISRVVRENNRVVSDYEFIWDGSFLSEIYEVTVRNNSGEVTTAVMTSYLYGVSDADLLSSYDRRSTRYHHSHPDGSTFLLTTNGDVTQWYRYSPFGETRILDWIQNSETARNLTDSKTLRLFGGALVDPLTGFHFIGSWYSPEHGRTF